MKRTYLITPLFFVLSFMALTSCQTKMTGYIEVHGRVVDYLTGLPITATVSLKADDATSAKNSTEASITMATTVTKSDGTFILKSKPSKRSRYYLFVDGQSKGLLGGAVKENQRNDLGDIIAGKHTFYCNITFVPKTDSCLDLTRGTRFHLEAHTAYQYLDSAVFSQATYGTNQHNYLISYQKYDCIHTGYYDYAYHSIAIPINTLTGIMSTTISY